jgi:hypothetical protein
VYHWRPVGVAVPRAPWVVGAVAAARVDEPDVRQHRSKLAPHVAEHLQRVLAEEVAARVRARGRSPAALALPRPTAVRRRHQQVVRLLPRRDAGAAACRHRRLPHSAARPKHAATLQLLGGSLMRRRRSLVEDAVVELIEWGRGSKDARQELAS